MRITWILALISVLAACAQPQPQTPEATYRAFYLSVSDKDWDRAVSFLSAETLDRFRQMGSRLAALREVDDDPLDTFLRRVYVESRDRHVPI